MKLQMEQGIILWIILVFLSGCVTTGTNTAHTDPCSPVDRSRLENEGTALVAIGGALAGAIIGQLHGKNTKSTLIGGASGLLAGGIIGREWGKTIADRKEQYASKECRLKGELDLVTARNSQLKASNKKLAAEVKRRKQTVARLKEQYLAKEIKAKDLKLQQEKIKQEVLALTEIKENLTAELSALKAYHDSIQASGDPVRLAELKIEIESLQSGINDLNTSNRELARMAATLDLRRS